MFRYFALSLIVLIVWVYLLGAFGVDIWWCWFGVWCDLLVVLWMVLVWLCWLFWLCWACFLYVSLIVWCGLWCIDTFDLFGRCCVRFVCAFDCVV